MNLIRIIYDLSFKKRNIDIRNELSVDMNLVGPTNSATVSPEILWTCVSYELRKMLHCMEEYMVSDKSADQGSDG